MVISKWWITHGAMKNNHALEKYGEYFWCNIKECRFQNTKYKVIIVLFFKLNVHKSIGTKVILEDYNSKCWDSLPLSGGTVGWYLFSLYLYLDIFYNFKWCHDYLKEKKGRHSIERELFYFKHLVSDFFLNWKRSSIPYITTEMTKGRVCLSDEIIDYSNWRMG